MSLLTICQTAAEEIGFTAPTSIIGNTEATAVRLRRLADRTGKDLSKKDWDLLLKEYTFSTTASEPQYALPSDYRSIAPATVWNQTTDMPLYRISRDCWAYEQSATTASYHDQFRMFGDDSGPSKVYDYTDPVSGGNDLLPVLQQELADGHWRNHRTVGIRRRRRRDDLRRRFDDAGRYLAATEVTGPAIS